MTHFAAQITTHRHAHAHTRVSFHLCCQAARDSGWLKDQGGCRRERMDDRSIMSARLSINVSIAITFAALDPRTHAQQFTSPSTKERTFPARSLFICIAIPILRYKFIHLQFTVFIVWILPNGPVSLLCTPSLAFAVSQNANQVQTAFVVTFRTNWHR